jgi:DNA polymerase-3 subunit gamma/tau
VLARKYRPRTFDDLIGQDAMVRTLSNAFETGRIPQAWMLTGVRGVGKTTTARILARGLNFELPEGTGAGKAAGPTIRMDGLGVHCEAIIEGRHIDVMEIDAASHTGVDNIRQINDAVRYAPVSARYKVYIIDEVHMLSTGAFNAFLKTLEEPPPHAKFVFATTEIRKVPITILSRCQRFDLRRVDAGLLANHLAGICAQEAVAADPEALAMIARAAEGSVRDALSLLDQAIAHAAGAVTPETVRAMLGLADRGRIVDLFEATLRGDVPAALAELKGQYDEGADPAIVLTELANFAHLVTRLKLVPDAAKDPALTEVERKRGADFAGRLSIRVLSRAWQILTKALPEVQGAARPIAAAEMVLVRLAYAADLPTPDEALRLLREGGFEGASTPAPSTGGNGGARMSMGGGNGSVGLARPMTTSQPQPSPAPAPQPTMRLARFEDVVALAAEKRDIGLKLALERDVRLVRFEDGQIEFAVVEGASRNLAADLGKKLQDWTGRRWIVAISSQAGAPTLQERAAAQKAERDSDAAAHPLVRAALAQFPGARIVDVRSTQAAADDAPEAMIETENLLDDGLPDLIDDADLAQAAGLDD